MLVIVMHYGVQRIHVRCVCNSIILLILMAMVVTLMGLRVDLCYAGKFLLQYLICTLLDPNNTMSKILSEFGLEVVLIQLIFYIVVSV